MKLSSAALSMGFSRCIWSTSESGQNAPQEHFLSPPKVGFLTSHRPKILVVWQATEASHWRTILPPIAACHLLMTSPRRGNSASSLIHHLNRGISITPLLIFLLPEHLDLLLLLITQLCNRSMPSKGVLPQLQKISILIPTLKNWWFHMLDFL